MALFEPLELKSYDGVDLPGISIASPCQLANTARIAVVSHGSISIQSGLGLGDYSKILTYGGNITIGSNVSIQDGCILYGHGGLKIGNYVSIASQTIIIPSNHDFSDMDIPIKLQGESGRGIVIGNSVWIGAGCKILDGVTIGDGCVIGAGSVVTHSMPKNCIVTGVPAKVLKKRKESTISKQKIIPGQTPLFFLIIGNDFGGVDWILPALFKFKQKNPGYEMITLFVDKDSFTAFSYKKFLLKQLLKLSSVNIVPEEIELLFSQGTLPDQIKIIFKDFNKSHDPLPITHILQKCPKAKLVNYPYSNIFRDNNSSKDLSGAFDKPDLFLVGSERDISFWSKKIGEKKIKALGLPKYDSWWVKAMVEDFALLKSEELTSATEAKIVFLYSQGDPVYDENCNSIKSIIKVVGKYQGAKLLIEAHPKQEKLNLARQLHLLKTYEKISWTISDLHMLQLAHISDVIISTGSPSILDALAVGKPVIEFRPPTQSTKDFVAPDIVPNESLFQNLKLVIPAHTMHELQKRIDSALNDSKNDIWEDQLHSFNSICISTESASDDIADCLMDLIS